MEIANIIMNWNTIDVLSNNSNDEMELAHEFVVVDVVVVVLDWQANKERPCGKMDSPGNVAMHTYLCRWCLWCNAVTVIGHPHCGRLRRSCRRFFYCWRAAGWLTPNWTRMCSRLAPYVSTGQLAMVKLARALTFLTVQCVLFNCVE